MNCAPGIWPSIRIRSYPPVFPAEVSLVTISTAIWPFSAVSTRNPIRVSSPNISLRVMDESSTTRSRRDRRGCSGSKSNAGLGGARTRAHVDWEAAEGVRSLSVGDDECVHVEWESALPEGVRRSLSGGEDKTGSGTMPAHVRWVEELVCDWRSRICISGVETGASSPTDRDD